MTAMTQIRADVALIRRRVQELLAERGDAQGVRDDDSLFFSGRLDSLAATQMMMLLEEAFGVDLADASFDVTQLDSIADIERFLGA
jgi:acyl carrier protein